MLKVAVSLLFLASSLAPPPLPEVLKGRPRAWVRADRVGLVADLAYRRETRYSKTPLYRDSSRAWMTKCVSSKLIEANRRLRRDGVQLVVFDAYRPFSATVKMWNWAVVNKMGTSMLAPPWAGSSHNRGAAVDVGLVCLVSGIAVPMPSEYDCLGAASSCSWPGGTEKETKNRSVLLGAMEAAGMVGHPLEWWHYSCPDCEKNEKIYNFEP